MLNKTEQLLNGSTVFGPLNQCPTVYVYNLTRQQHLPLGSDVCIRHI